MKTAGLAERLSALDARDDEDRDGGCSPVELRELVAVVERLHTLIAVATSAFDATGELTADGYRSPAGFLTGDGGRIGRGSARRYLSCGRILAQFPLLATAAEAGEITFDHVAVFARLLPASASEHRRACIVRDEARLVAEAKAHSASGFSAWCASWRHEVDPDNRFEERLGREDHGMTVRQLDVGSSELRLRGDTAEIEQLRAAIDRLANEAWRRQRNTEGTDAPDPKAKPADDRVASATPDEHEASVIGDTDAGESHARTEQRQQRSEQQARCRRPGHRRAERPPLVGAS